MEKGKERDLYLRLFEHYNDNPWLRAGHNEIIMEIYRLTFTPQEAEIALELEFPKELGGKGRMKTASEIATALGKKEDEVTSMLEGMLIRCAVFKMEIQGSIYYFTLGFSVICDAYQGVDTCKIAGGSIDKAMKLGELWTRYYGLGPQDNPVMGQIVEFASDYPVQRVVPVLGSIVEGGYVHDWERLEQILDNAQLITVIQCPCRKRHARFTGCMKPLEVTICLDLLAAAYIQTYGTKPITKDGALKILEFGAENGLIAITLNTKSGPGQVLNICQCCTDCCNFIAPYVLTPDPRSVAKSNFLPERDADKCTYCKTCVTTCPVNAIIYHAPYKLDRSDEAVVVMEDRCLGCGLCVCHCPEGALSLTRVRDQIPVDTIPEMIQRFDEGRAFK